MSFGTIMSPLFGEGKMNRTDRLYAIVETLRLVGNRGRSSAWLSQRFEVSTRTVKRDIAALVESGVPIISYDGRGGGYSLSRDATLPPLAFTSGEAISIAIALKVEPNIPFAPDGVAALSKLLSAMTPAQRVMLDNLSSRIWMRQISNNRNATASIIEEALRDSVAVSIDYRTDDAPVALTRTIEPMAFVRTQNNWHVLAWCRLRNSGRWFRMDRIVRAHATNQKITPRDLAETFGEPPDDALPIDAMHGL